MVYANLPAPYAGIRFLSRIEARWAATFDALGWGWDYQPVDFVRWVPDFVIDRPGSRVLVGCTRSRHPEELAPHSARVDSALSETFPLPVLLVGNGPMKNIVGLYSVKRGGWKSKAVSREVREAWKSSASAASWSSSSHRLIAVPDEISWKDRAINLRRAYGDSEATKVELFSSLVETIAKKCETSAGILMHANRVYMNNHSLHCEFLKHSVAMAWMSSPAINSMTMLVEFEGYELTMGMINLEEGSPDGI